MARQGTTPIVSFDVPKDFTNYNVYVTIDQDGTQVTKASRVSEDVEITKHYKEDGTFDYSTVALHLSQEETLGFEVGVARVQLRYIDFLNTAEATDIGTFNIEESLYQGVIEYGD